MGGNLTAPKVSKLPRLEYILCFLLATASFVSSDISITSCPEECNCEPVYGKPTTDCSHNNIMEIPDNLSPETEILDLSRNNILDLRDDIFKDLDIDELEFLYLSHNAIEYLSLDSLRGLTRLVVLDLSHNRLRYVHPESFKYNHRLQTLYLGGNPLKIFDSGPLLMIPSLTSLDLSSTSLRHLSDRSFLGTEELVSLNLSGNHLSYMNPEALSPLRHLTVLDISWNRFPCNCDSMRFYNVLQRSSFIVQGEFTCIEDGDARRMLGEFGDLCINKHSTHSTPTKYDDDDHDEYDPFNAVKIPNPEDSYLWPIIGGLLTATCLFLILMTALIVTNWYDGRGHFVQRRHLVQRDRDFEEHTRVLLSPEGIFHKIKHHHGHALNAQFTLPHDLYQGDITPYVHHHHTKLYNRPNVDF